MASRWLPGLRAILTIGRELRLARLQLTRIADALDGTQHVQSVAEATEEMTVRPSSEADYALFYGAELELERTLGRSPTPEEIVHYVDGHEPGDFPRLRRRGTQ